ncbi:MULTISPECIES: type II secretion system protein GspL [Pseudoalteromonas]|uniref:Type II secretion system protein L n=1 Tax=Pseudoalteromonas lipolytica TaxID=570156 RepID=A0AAD0WBF1_9GAMM|nr:MULTISPECIES: type II secretion system protein GspL [Pseudoalteromonas]AXV64090.1 type II secretion system protein GspL [Pseudoalteromonas donghaensis]EWH04046.1 general secretion pathway protein GspL [Pseudoalteromonas lipolytica SCSIO 04301]MBE0352237.1 general secretion pathway protein L [Pseudoalteromonas lipolytica LMEB 39]QPL43193.1 type II secretion system protein GspL [Pseudoalteromonas sp. A41-2]SFU02007.1 general secretion pathway protein L [Pseudoalteromonas lipolytica]
MTEILLIRAGQTLQDSLSWLIYSPTEQEIIASGEIASAAQLGELTEKAQTREVVALLPSDQIQLKTVELPTKWSRKLEQALPYMLEEDIACDVDDLFIAIAEPTLIDEKHAVNIAMTDREWFEQWLATFNEHDIEVFKVLPDALLLPRVDNENTLRTVELNGQWLCKLGHWHIAAVETDWLDGYLTAMGHPDVAHFSPATGFPESVNLEAKTELYDLPLALFAKQLPEISFNLRQGVYQLKKKSAIWWGYWQKAAIAAGVALVCSVGVKSLELYKLNTQLEKTKAQVVTNYQRAFPNKKVRPQLIRSQIRNELALLDSGSTAGFLDLTNDLVTIFSEVKDFTPETLRYDQGRNELRIRARGKDFQSFGKVKAILEQRGLTVDQGSLNNDGDFVVGEIKLRGAA